MDLLLELAALPLVGILEAWVGLLWPSEDSGVRRLQRVAQAIFIVALAALSVAVLLAYADHAISYRSLIFFAVAYIGLIAAGIVGRTIEKRCQRDTHKPS